MLPLLALPIAVPGRAAAALEIGYSLGNDDWLPTAAERGCFVRVNTQVKTSVFTGGVCANVQIASSCQRWCAGATGN